MSLYPGRSGIQSPSQLSPESRLNYAMRGWPHLDLNDSVNRGLLGYWSMDGGTISGAAIRDLSGSGNDGTINGASIVTGRIGQALSFNGTTQYVDVGPINTLAGSPGVTITFWAYQTANLQASYFAKTGNGVINFQPWSNGNIYFSLNGAQVFATTPYPLNKWYFAAVTAYSNLYWIIVDNVVAATGALTTTIPSDTLHNFTIGTDGVGNFFPGYLDDFRLFNVGKSLADISRIYSDTSGNLGLITPTRNMVASAAPPPGGNPHFLPLLGAGGVIALEAARMLSNNPTVSRRRLLTFGQSDVTGRSRD